MHYSNQLRTTYIVHTIELSVFGKGIVCERFSGLFDDILDLILFYRQVDLQNLRFFVLDKYFSFGKYCYPAFISLFPQVFFSEFCNLMYLFLHYAISWSFNDWKIAEHSFLNICSIKNPQFLPNQADIQAILPTLELLIFTKFHYK